MLHKAYIPEREQIIEVIGTVRYDDGIHFIFWDQTQGKYNEVHVGDCVPYDGEILPRKVIEPTWILPQKGSVPTLKSLVEPGETYDEACDDCPMRSRASGSPLRNKFLDRVKNEEAKDPKGDGQVDGGPTGGFDGQ